MPSNWPTSLDSYTTKVDGIDDVLAAHVNALQDAILALETELGVGGLKGSVASLTARLNVSLNADGTLKTTAIPNPIPTDYVATASIQNLAVTTGKIANSAVDSTKLANGAVTAGKFAAAAIATADIGNNQITSALITSDAVTTGKIADGAVTPIKLAVGIRNQHETFLDLAAAGTATVVALTTPDTALHTTSITHPDVPRALSFSLKNTTAGALTNTAVNATLIGVDSKGEALTEVIQIPSQSIAAGATVTVSGNKPFATLTSWQLDQAQSTPADWQVSFGTTDKVGLATTVASVYKTNKNGAHVGTPTVSTTHNTIDLATISANDDWSVWYRMA